MGAGVCAAEWWLHAAIQSAAALEQEAAVPVGGHRHGEPDSVGFAVAAGALIDHAIDAAMRRHRG